MDGYLDSQRLFKQIIQIRPAKDDAKRGNLIQARNLRLRRHPSAAIKLPLRHKQPIKLRTSSKHAKTLRH